MENMGERKETHSVWVQQIMFKPFHLWKMTGRGKRLQIFESIAQRSRSLFLLKIRCHIIVNETMNFTFL